MGPQVAGGSYASVRPIPTFWLKLEATWPFHGCFSSSALCGVRVSQTTSSAYIPVYMEAHVPLNKSEPLTSRAGVLYPMVANDESERSHGDMALVFSEQSTWKYLHVVSRNLAVALGTRLLFYVCSMSGNQLWQVFPSSSVVKNLPTSARDAGSIPGSGRSSGEGNGNVLQYFCLKNPMDRETWRATVKWKSLSHVWFFATPWTV